MTKPERGMIQLNKRLVLLLSLCLLVAMLAAGCGGDSAAVEIKLLPAQANLESAPGLVLEQTNKVDNLGGWTDNNEPVWKVDIKEAGMYKILIEYSRPGGEAKAWGLVMLANDDLGEYKSLNFSAQPTGKDSADWSVYTINDSCGASLQPGTWYVSLRPNFGDDYNGTEYFMNLRSVTLRLDKGDS